MNQQERFLIGTSADDVAEDMARADKARRGKFSSSLEFERSLRNRRVFESVIDLYLHASSCQTVVAQCYGPAQKRAKFTPTQCEYKADVETLTNKVLNNDPAKWAAWCNLVLGKKVDAKVEAAIIRLCAPVYWQHLLAYKYFDPYWFKKQKEKSGQQMKSVQPTMVADQNTGGSSSTIQQ